MSVFSLIYIYIYILLNKVHYSCNENLLGASYGLALALGRPTVFPTTKGRQW